MVSDQRADQNTPDEGSINLANALGLIIELLAAVGQPVSSRTISRVFQAAAGSDEASEALLTNGFVKPLPRAHAASDCFKLVDSSSSLRSSSSSTQVAPATCDEGVPEKKKTRTPREQKLDFDRPLLDARYAILRAVWLRVEPLIGRSTTWTSWRARNAAVAMDLARGGFTPEQVVHGWDLASQERGEPVRELSRVQRFIERVESSVAKHKATTKP